MNFSNLNRQEIVTKLKTQIFDVLVIGGGITGAGIALDAASRGMNTALVEMQDFSSGTSSRSTKLVHGGLRYLKQFEVKMVAEVGKERSFVYENGPHVTTPEWMILPLYKKGTYGKISTSLGLRLYDYLAGVKKNERRKMLSKEETLRLEPLLKKEELIGSGFYVEYRTDDSRLTIEVLKAAFDHGALAINYTKVAAFIYENERIVGAHVLDQLSSEAYEIRARVVVNATGPWVDSIRELDHSRTGKMLRLSKGSHIVINQLRFPLRQAVYFDTPDGRMVFAIPRDGKVYVGTTDTFFEDDAKSPFITDNDCEYIINAINFMFPSIQIKLKDIESSWAGVRPLIFEKGKNPSEISRKDEIWQSHSGLITIAGGKLTGYRKMAETIVDQIVNNLSKKKKISYPSCLTKNLPISGGRVGGSLYFQKYIELQVNQGEKLGLEKEDATHLAKMYGSNASRLFELIPESRELAIKFGIPIRLALKLLYAIQHEMVSSPLDYFFRRTGELLFDIKLVENYKYNVTNLMAKVFQWNKSQENYYRTEIEYEINRASLSYDSEQ